MSSSSRREFTKKSLLLALGPVAGESAILSSPLSNALAEPQAPARDFFAGFSREQIKTTGATINVVLEEVTAFRRHARPVRALHGTARAREGEPGPRSRRHDQAVPGLRSRPPPGRSVGLTACGRRR